MLPAEYLDMQPERERKGTQEESNKDGWEADSFVFDMIACAGIWHYAIINDS